ncbi:hypothetical protein [uncultured Cellulomonas sp.]|uniref:hypothetical protein n=1 Tax=uncultured Cellulomonas sp. TaxID=189682 RepID=UPI002623AA1C|nr:hypothetical protein [uncultured Cellulomonas sp.]
MDSDQHLLAAARAGDVEASAALLARHAPAARALGQRYVTSPVVDDVLAEAFDEVVSGAGDDAGPRLPFRARLLRAVRDGAARRAGTVVDGAAPALPDDAVLRAYRAVPEPLQDVLWYRMVEALPSPDVARALGLPLSAVPPAIARARDGLRDAFLDRHREPAVDAGCTWVDSRLRAYLRGRTRDKETLAVREHADRCARCGVVVEEAEGVGQRLAAAMQSLVLGPTGLGDLAGVGLAVERGPRTDAVPTARTTGTTVALEGTAGAVAGSTAAATTAGAGRALAASPAARTPRPAAAAAASASAEPGGSARSALGRVPGRSTGARLAGAVSDRPAETFAVVALSALLATVGVALVAGGQQPGPGERATGVEESATTTPGGEPAAGTTPWDAGDGSGGASGPDPSSPGGSSVGDPDAGGSQPSWAYPGTIPVRAPETAPDGSATGGSPRDTNADASPDGVGTSSAVGRPTGDGDAAVTGSPTRERPSVTPAPGVVDPTTPASGAPAGSTPVRVTPVAPTPARPVPTTPVPGNPAPANPAPANPAPAAPSPAKPAPAPPAPPAPVAPAPGDGRPGRPPADGSGGPGNGGPGNGGPGNGPPGGDGPPGQGPPDGRPGNGPPGGGGPPGRNR